MVVKADDGTQKFTQVDSGCSRLVQSLDNFRRNWLNFLPAEGRENMLYHTLQLHLSYHTGLRLVDCLEYLGLAGHRLGLEQLDKEVGRLSPQNVVALIVKNGHYTLFH